MLALLLALTAAAGPTTEAEISAEIRTIRDAFTRDERECDVGHLPSVQFSLGGGQNPNHWTVHWARTDDAVFERDPYAAPFTARRLRVEKVLPAVGPTTLTFWYHEDGELYFAFIQGSDAWGAGWDLHPTDELRVYFADEEPFRVIATQHDGKRTIDIPLGGIHADRARQAGRNLARVGQEWREAVGVLAR